MFKRKQNFICLLILLLLVNSFAWKGGSSGGRSGISGGRSGSMSGSSGGRSGSSSRGGGSENFKDRPEYQAKKNERLGGIKSVESSGDYKAQNSHSSASGGYQFTKGTWKDTVPKSTFEKYPNAKDAPPDVQDKAASDHYDKLYGKFENHHDTTRAWNQGAAGAAQNPEKGEKYANKVEQTMRKGQEQDK